MAGRLAGRTCMIVGGTGGIGLAATRRFLREGAHVLVAGLAPGLDDAARRALGDDDRLAHIVVDASNPADVERMFLEFSRLVNPRLDILLHVAGISGRRWGDGPLHECSDEGWHHVLASNAYGTFLTNRGAVRTMRSQDPDDHGLRGTIVNIGSILAESPAPEHFSTIAYASSKGAIRALTIASASRYAEEKIRFNLIEPGLIETPMASRAVGDPRIAHYLATKQPMRGGPGLAEDVAEAALFLCEPATSFITGAVVPVDGGWHLADGQISRGGETA